MNRPQIVPVLGFERPLASRLCTAGIAAAQALILEEHLSRLGGYWRFHYSTLHIGRPSLGDLYVCDHGP